jgi:hypothetical protein
MMCKACRAGGDLQTKIADSINAFVESARRLAGDDGISPTRETELRRMALIVNRGSISEIAPLHEKCDRPGCTCQHTLPEWVTSGTLPP